MMYGAFPQPLLDIRYGRSFGLVPPTFVTPIQGVRISSFQPPSDSIFDSTYSTCGTYSAHDWGADMPLHKLGSLFEAW